MRKDWFELSKRKTRKNVKKPVNSVIEITFNNSVSSSGISMENDKISIIDNDGKKIIPDDITYKRVSTRGENKEKTISSLHVNDGNNSTINIGLPAFANFDFVFAIDTNARQIESQMIYCTAASHILYHKQKREAYCEFVGGFIFIDPIIPAEKVGWFHFMDRIMRRYGRILKGKKAVLLTDHDLTKHDDINNHIITMVPNIGIPNEFCLAYASADRLDNEANEFIRFCDKEATTILRNIDDIKINNLSLNNSNGYFCKYISGVRNSNDIRLPNILYLSD